MFDIAHSINGFLEEMEREFEGGRGYGNIPTRSVNSFLQACLADEFTLRRLFATDRENPMVKSPYVGLFDIFDLPHQARLARPRDWEEPGFIWRHQGKDHHLPQKHILPVQPSWRKTRGAPCIVEDLETFRERWDVFSCGILSGITDWEKIMIAGGAVHACLSYLCSDLSRKQLFKFYQLDPYQSSDIDLFLWGMNEEEAKNKMQEIFDAVNRSLLWDAVCFRTKNTITIQAEYPKRPIQIIMRLYSSPAEILCGFDVDCCCVAYNGTNVFTNPRGLTAIVRQCNTINLTRRSPSYEHRLAKYSARGYEIFYPGLERSRIDYGQLADPDRSHFPKGLGRLIVHEIMEADFLYLPNIYEGRSSIRTNPVPSDDLRPSNYDYAWCRIPYGPKWWDTQAVRRHVEKVGSEIMTAISRSTDGGSPLTHQHVITCGTMSECLERCCDSMTVNPIAEPPSREGQTNGLFSGPATFMTDDPGRQMIGSFNPTNYGVWEFEAYVGESDEESGISTISL